MKEKFEILDVDAADIQKKYFFTSLTSKLIKASGIDEEKILQLRNPPVLSTSKDTCVIACAQRIMRAKANHEKVFIGGDYDADGICSTAIMKYTLDALGIPNGYYIPNRLKEGYGLHNNIIELAHKKGYSLLITVDNGVKCNEQIDLAHSLGMDVIITDHHVIEEDVHAKIVVHPDYMSKQYSTLSGAGVALEISRNLIGNVPKLTAFAAVAAVGDVMPLWYETRAIVIEGIRLLNEGFPKSLYALLHDVTHIDYQSIAYQIVPKLNAVARLSDHYNANKVVPFLLEDNCYRISKFVSMLNDINEERKKVSQEMLNTANTCVQTDNKFLVAYDPSFKQGIVGIVAGKLKEEFRKPAIVFADNGEDKLAGSARSVEGLDVYDFFSDFPNLLTFGGHEMAAGLTIKKEDYPAFCKMVQAKMAKMQIKEIRQPSVLVSAEEFNLESLTELERLDPLPKELQNIRISISKLNCTGLKKWEKVQKYHFDNTKEGFDGVVFTKNNIETKENPKIITGEGSINRFRNTMNPQLLVEEIS